MKELAAWKKLYKAVGKDDSICGLLCEFRFLGLITLDTHNKMVSRLFKRAEKQGAEVYTGRRFYISDFLWPYTPEGHQGRKQWIARQIRRLQ